MIPTPKQEIETLDLEELDARNQCRDLSQTLRDLIKQVKAESRNNKALQSELQNAKGVLTKLKDLAA